MRLKEAIADALSWRGASGSAQLPEKPSLRDAAAQLARTYVDGGRIPTSETLAELLTRFSAACDSNEWEELSGRDWNRVIFGIWLAPQVLANDARFMARLIARLSERRRRSDFQNLIIAYLQHFEPANDSIGRASEVILDALSDFSWPWSERHKRFHLFDPVRAPHTLARCVLDPEQRPDEVLQAAGLTGPRASAGLAAAAYEEALSELARLFSADGDHSYAFTSICDWSVDGDHLRFPRLKERLAETFLRPWATRDAPDDLRSVVMAFLLRHYRDPRLEPRLWMGVSDDAQRVLRRWLTGADLETFIQVVDDVAERGHWRYRKAFWMAYLEKDLLEEAWLVFGRRARLRARRLEATTAGHGRLVGGSVQSNHCVILMRIGRLTVADWSHDGKCRIWREANREAPRLYQSNYSRGELADGCDLEIAHFGSDRSRWQTQIATFIRDQTGIRVSSTDWTARA